MMNIILITNGSDCSMYLRWMLRDSKRLTIDKPLSAHGVSDHASRKQCLASAHRYIHHPVLSP